MPTRSKALASGLGCIFVPQETGRYSSDAEYRRAFELSICEDDYLHLLHTSNRFYEKGDYFSRGYFDRYVEPYSYLLGTYNSGAQWACQL